MVIWLGKIDFESAVNETEVIDTKDTSWHPKYEWVGKAARGYAKKAFITLIPYLIWGTIFGWVFTNGGMGALAITVSVSILYTIRQVGGTIKEAIEKKATL
jgi:hypothetical protein